MVTARRTPNVSARNALKNPEFYSEHGRVTLRLVLRVVLLLLCRRIQDISELFSLTRVERNVVEGRRSVVHDVFRMVVLIIPNPIKILVSRLMRTDSDQAIVALRTSRSCLNSSRRISRTANATATVREISFHARRVLPVDIRSHLNLAIVVLLEVNVDSVCINTNVLSS